MIFKQRRSLSWIELGGHGAVEDYVKAGGYRAAFYYAQDWDLWYRLAALGTFATVESR